MPTDLNLPYPPLKVIAVDGALTWTVLEAAVGRRLRRGVSICLQAADGHQDRGGYFFHVKATAKGFVFRTFDRESVLTVAGPEECLALINHASGRAYSEKMWELSQLINLRSDP